ncbi:Diphosphomevalonate decarboxylase, partial [Intoshia linei]
MYYKIKYRCPSNIALIKYWGKSNEENMTPLNDSISISLDDSICSETTLEVSDAFKQDEIIINDWFEKILKFKKIFSKLEKINSRYTRVFQLVRSEVSQNTTSPFYKVNWHFRLTSHNNFPTASGLASSASGFACLALCLQQIFNLKCNVAILARLGSGSACRSVLSGFVHWIKTDNTTSDCINQIANHRHWDSLRVFILIINENNKKISSKKAMQQCLLEKKAEMLTHAQKVNFEIIDQMKDAILNKNFRKLAEITMNESDRLHNLCESLSTKISFLSEQSRLIIQLIIALNKHFDDVKFCYTFDAGENALVICEHKYAIIFKSIVNFLQKSVIWKGNEIDSTNHSINAKLSQKLKCILPQMNIKYGIISRVGKDRRIVYNYTTYVRYDYINYMENHTLYYVKLRIGIPAKLLKVIIDTSSPVFMTYKEHCYHGTCVTKYDPFKSYSSRRLQPYETNIPYNNYNFKWDGFTDIVGTGYTLKKQRFISERLYMSNALQNLSGILGFGKYWNTTKSNSFVYDLLTKKKQAIVGIYLNRKITEMSGGEISIGGINEKYINSNVSFVPSADPNYWMFHGDS